MFLTVLIVVPHSAPCRRVPRNRQCVPAVHRITLLRSRGIHTCSSICLSLSLVLVVMMRSKALKTSRSILMLILRFSLLSVVCCLLSVVCSLFSALMLILSLLCLHCTHSVARWVAQLSGALQVIASSPEAAPAGLLRNLGLYRDGLAAYRARR